MVVGVAGSAGTRSVQSESRWAYPFVITLFAIGMVIYGLRAIDYFSAVPGDLGDARFNSVILEHLFQWATGKADLWNPTFFYPFADVLAFSDNHFGSGPIYVLFRLLGLGREQAFDGWYLTGFALNFVATFVALRKIGFSAVAAAVGAFLFTFALPALAQDGHAQLTYRLGIPLAWAALWEALRQRRWQPATWVVLWTTVEMFFSIYLGLFLIDLVFATLVGFAVVERLKMAPPAIAAPRSQARAGLASGVTVTILCFAALAWLFYHYQWAASHYGFSRSWEEIASMLPRPQSYLLADADQLTGWIGSWVQQMPMRWEHQMFFGVACWALAIIGYVQVRRQQATDQTALAYTAILAFSILVAMTLILGGSSVYIVFSVLPGFSAIRAVARIAIVMALPLTILAAIGVEALIEPAKRAGPVIAAGAMVLLLAAVSAEVASFSVGFTPIEAWHQRVADLKTHVPANLPGDALLFVTNAESKAPYWITALDTMILAQDSGIATLNGYSGNSPPGSTDPEPCMTGTNELLGYENFAGLNQASINALNARIVDVRLTACDQLPAVPFAGKVDVRQISLLSLAITQLKRDNKFITADIELTNHSTSQFDTLSRTNQPVRLQFRFVPVSAAGVRLAEPAWGPRKTLIWSLPPSATGATTFSTGVPMLEGHYLLELSLVQVGGVSFDANGMKVASALIPDQ